MNTDVTLVHAQALLKAGQLAECFSACEQLLASMPNEADEIQIRYLLAVVYRYQKQWKAAERELRRLIKLTPDYGRAFQELGHIFKTLGHTQQAISAYQDAVKRNAGLLASWQALQALSHDATIQHTAQINIHYLNSLPRVLQSVISMTAEGKFARAEQLCRHVLQADPKHVEAMRLLAAIAEKNHVLDDAELLLSSALAFDADNQWVMFDLINVLHRRQKFQQALTLAQQLYHQRQSDPHVMLVLANQLAAVGDYSQALEHYQKLSGTEVDDALLYLLQGHTLKTIGEQAQAIESYRESIRRSPNFGDAYWSLANLKTFTFTDDELQQMRSLVQHESLIAADFIHLCFALGKAYEDRQQYDDSFHFYARGNQAKRDSMRYSPTAMQASFDAQKRVFTSKLTARLSTYGCPSNEPIFILGLPRAGSTLVEQMLSSHSQIDGTIELPNIMAYAHELNGRKYQHTQAQYPECLENLSAETLQALGQRYIDETHIFRQQGAYFIDKMPNNFRHIGLIKSILPNAKIIDVRRHPLACCFSGFKQLFAEGQEFSYDLDDIAQYYQGYVDLMAHWDQVYPQQIYTLSYEALVADPQHELEKLFDYLALPLEPACLNFHTNQRAVRTASSEQVRQPINTKGLFPWQPYKAHLGTLFQYFDM